MEKEKAGKGARMSEAGGGGLQPRKTFSSAVTGKGAESLGTGSAWRHVDHGRLSRVCGLRSWKDSTLRA